VSTTPFNSATLGLAIAALLMVAGCDQRNASTPSTQPQSGTATPPGTTPRNDPALATTPPSTPGGAATAPAPSAGGAAPSTNAATLTDADRSFVAGAAQAGMAEVEAGKLANDKASSSAVKSFADHMVKDHSKVHDELMALASKKGVSPPAEMRADQRATMAKLQQLSGAEFDQAYAMQIGVEAHQETIALFEKASRDVNDADLKAFAVKTLPDLKEHLGMAQKLQGEVASGDKGSK